MENDGTCYVSIDLAEGPGLAEKARNAAAGETNCSVIAEPSFAATPTCVAADAHSDNGNGDRRKQGVRQTILGAVNDQLLAQDAGFHSEARGNVKRLTTAIALCSFFFVIELCGALFAGSLALLSDSFHLLGDCVSFLISLLAIRLSRKRNTKEFTFGYSRAEVIGALMSVFLIWGLTAELCVQAVDRFINPLPVDGKTMFAVAACGVCVNVVSVFALHDHSARNHGYGRHHRRRAYSLDEYPSHYRDHHGLRRQNTSVAHIRLHDLDNGEKALHDDGDAAMESVPLDDDADCETTSSPRTNINIRAAMLHVIGDMLSSIGVLVASVVIMLGGPSQVDPVCTFLFSAMVFATTVGVARESISVLMEGAPREADMSGLVSSLRALPGVVNVHGLHVWELTSGKSSMSVHLVVRGAERTSGASSSSSSSSYSSSADSEVPLAAPARLLNDARAAAARHGCIGRLCAVQLEPDDGFWCEEREGWDLDGWEREV